MAAKMLKEEERELYLAAEEEDETVVSKGECFFTYFT